MKPVELQLRQDRDLGTFTATLADWLRSTSGWAGATVVSVDRVVGAGSANETLTMAVHRPDHDEPAHLVVRLVVPGMDVFYDADLVRQAAVIAWVRDHTDVPVANVLGVEPTGELLGAPFMVMERLDGTAAPDYPGYNRQGFLVEAPVAQRRALWTDALGTMCRLHVADTSTLDVLAGSGGRGPGALLDHWRRALEWIGARCDVQPFVSTVDWLGAHVPADAPDGLSWGDARIGNMLFVGSRCTAVLDWELASLGGPLHDLAWWLMFDLIQSVDMGVPRLAGLGGREETIAGWESGTGLSTGALTWYEVFAHLQLAMTRANVFAQRESLGLPVPPPDDPRAVGRLMERIPAIVAAGTA